VALSSYFIPSGLPSGIWGNSKGRLCPSSVRERQATWPFAGPSWYLPTAEQKPAHRDRFDSRLTPALFSAYWTVTLNPGSELKRKGEGASGNVLGVRTPWMGVQISPPSPGTRVSHTTGMPAVNLTRGLALVQGAKGNRVCRFLCQFQAYFGGHSRTLADNQSAVSGGFSTNPPLSRMFSE
jgi:hypothetical protein